MSDKCYTQINKMHGLKRNQTREVNYPDGTIRIHKVIEVAKWGFTEEPVIISAIGSSGDRDIYCEMPMVVGNWK